MSAYAGNASRPPFAGDQPHSGLSDCAPFASSRINAKIRAVKAEPNRDTSLLQLSGCPPPVLRN
eukprot:3000747-Pyramimonas_sp.AAC.1